MFEFLHLFSYILYGPDRCLSLSLILGMDRKKSNPTQIHDFFYRVWILVEFEFEKLDQTKEKHDRFGWDLNTT